MPSPNPHKMINFHMVSLISSFYFNTLYGTDTLNKIKTLQVSICLYRKICFKCLSLSFAWLILQPRFVVSKFTPDIINKSKSFQVQVEDLMQKKTLISKQTSKRTCNSLFQKWFHHNAVLHDISSYFRIVVSLSVH